MELLYCLTALEAMYFCIGRKSHGLIYFHLLIHISLFFKESFSIQMFLQIFNNFERIESIAVSSGNIAVITFAKIEISAV